MKLGQRIYNRIAPPLIELRPKELQLLEQMYPDIEWDYVHCYNGMPWFMYYTFAIGTALPHTYRGREIHIYLENYDQLSTEQRLLILVHEAFHIQQYQELNDMGQQSKRWGFHRKFIRYYLGWYFQQLYQLCKSRKHSWASCLQQAYRQHPMEAPAYRHEHLLAQHLALYRGHSVSNLLKQVPKLICTNAQLPARPAFIFYAMGSILALTISIIKPVLEIGLWGIALMFGGRTSNLL